MVVPDSSLVRVVSVDHDADDAKQVGRSRKAEGDVSAVPEGGDDTGREEGAGL